jgi:hypothetical protein
LGDIDLEVIQEMEDYNPQQPIKNCYESKLDRWKPIIDELMKAELLIIDENDYPVS